MFIRVVIIIFALMSLPVSIAIPAATAGGDPHPLIQAEYCLQESFNVTCPPNHVILMTSAKYGRMKSGKCISISYGHMGCSTEVTSRMDEECSGRERCDFPVTKLLGEKPCPTDLTSYLEVTHRCAPVVENKCGVHQPTRENYSNVPLQPPNQRSGHLVLFRHFPRCPWKFTADRTQRIKFILFNFADSNNNNNNDNNKPPQQKMHAGSTSLGHKATPPFHGGDKVCSWAVSFEEAGVESRPKELDLCSYRSRENLLYTSKRSSVSMQATLNKHLIPATPHLIKFEAIGCPELVVPKHAWMMQNEHRATVKCNFTDETWFLACNGHDWNGEIGNCSKPIGDGISIMLESSLNRYNPLPIAVMVGVVLGIVIGSVPLALVYVCLRRKWREQQEAELHQHQHHLALQQHQTTALCARDPMATYCTDGQQCMPLTSKDFCRACPVIRGEKQKLHAATLVNKTTDDDSFLYGMVPGASPSSAVNNNSNSSNSRMMMMMMQPNFSCCSSEWLDRPDVASMTPGTPNLSASPILPKNRKTYDNPAIHKFVTLSKTQPPSVPTHRNFDAGNHPVA